MITFKSKERIGYNLYMPRKILIVDDTRNIQLMISDFLSNQDYEVLTASDGIEAFDVFHRESPDLILLDIMMPNMDGYQFINNLRKESDIPVIMITAKQQETDLIKGFDLGADDYITKPFNLRELLMRIRAVLRRSSLREQESHLIQIGKVRLDGSKHEVQVEGQTVQLTPIEFKILEMLMRNTGKVMKHQDISMILVENGFAGSESTLKIHIKNIRQKLGGNSANPRLIDTVFGVGYRFLEENS